MTNGKPPFPPFDCDAALKKVTAAEDAWNSRDPDRVAMAYSQDTHWRNRAEIFRGRDAAREFLRRKWDKELDYRLVKEMWAFLANRIAVRFQYEWRDDAGQWYRSLNLLDGWRNTLCDCSAVVAAAGLAGDPGRSGNGHQGGGLTADPR